MKKLLLLLLAPIFCVAQVKHPAPTQAHRQNPSMVGLGPFKIGQTTPADVAKLCASTAIALQSSYSLQQTRDSGDSTVAFIVPYESTEDFADASYLSSPSANVRVYYFPEFTVADIHLTGVTLKFHKNTLATIDVEGYDGLPDAFELKYGKPALTTLTQSSACLYRMTGNKTIFKDESFFQRWYNGDIVALYFLGSTRDEHCTKKPIGSFSIESQAAKKLIEQEDAVALKANALRRASAKPKKLTDL